MLPLALHFESVCSTLKIVYKCSYFDIINMSLLNLLKKYPVVTVLVINGVLDASFIIVI